MFHEMIGSQDTIFIVRTKDKPLGVGDMFHSFTPFVDRKFTCKVSEIIAIPRIEFGEYVNMGMAHKIGYEDMGGNESEENSRCVCKK